ncbi:leucine-rich repeat-containing protein 56 [Schistocerca cancellata]|uniref:leucine-rich repeat-containing protein 56 n=1 Tax=Schistocerca cancellata TaxID=274614 RepID=UPI002117A591|nr:leucine-rich repeat-containing protein 56 [Schistocerca cancellata]
MSPRNAAQDEVPCTESEEAMEGEAGEAANSGSSSSSTPTTSLPPHQEPPPSLPPPGAPDVLPLDHTLPDLLRQVAGTEALPAVRELKLRVIARETSLQRLSLYVPALRELNLDGSCLSSLRDLGCGLGSLQLLRLAGCGLDSLDGTSGLAAVRELHAPNNRVSDVSPAAFLPRLRVLDLRRNAVCDLAGVGFLACCRRLQSLHLSGNPAAAANTYRRDVARLLPKLPQLDGLPLQQHENRRQTGGSGSGVRPQTATSAALVLAKPQPTGSRGPTRGRRRPFSAAPCLPTYQRLPDEGGVAAADGDSPSALTSGGVVCGNLAAALRSRRKGVRGAWQEKPEADPSAGGEAADVCPPRTGGLLEASRRWRQLYASYRSQHR